MISPFQSFLHEQISGQYLYPVVRFAWLRLAANHDPTTYFRILDGKTSQGSQVITGDLGARFCLDGHRHFAQQEINRDDAGESPVSHRPVELSVVGLCGELVAVHSTYGTLCLECAIGFGHRHPPPLPNHGRGPIPPVSTHGCVGHTIENNVSCTI